MTRRRRRPGKFPVWILWSAGAALVAGVVLVAAQPWNGGGSSPVAAGLGTASSHSASPTGTASGATSSARPSASASGSTASASATPSASTGASPTHTVGTQAAAPPANADPVVAAAAYRTVTFVNDVQQTIWVGAGEQTPQPALTTTGWVVPVGQSVTITVPDKWNGRFWGRTGCSFDGSGNGRCQTGDCAGRFQCAQYGQIPATLAEFNLNSWQNLDFYDVSMVDGSNLPMYINITKGATKDPISSTGCAPSGCTSPVNCPSALQIKSGGAMVACESACAVFGTDQYCCRGAWAPRSACDPSKWPIDYAAVFKRAEPFAYSYVDDDATSTFTCGGECDYRITFGLSP